MEGLALACLVALNTGFLPFSDFVTSEHLVASQVKWASGGTEALAVQTPALWGGNNLIAC